jgi:hypothetical protein
MTTATITGGCLCGAVRFTVRRPPTISMLCHCRSCRRAAGAPAVAWLTFRTEDFAVVRGMPTAFRSSPAVTRTFCGACGSPLTYGHADRPEEIDVTTVSLDDAEAFPPTHHAWRADGVAWLRCADGLPVHPQASGASE